MKKEVKPEFKISIHAPERVLLQFTSLWNQVKTPVPCIVIKNRNSKIRKPASRPHIWHRPIGSLGKLPNHSIPQSPYLEMGIIKASTQQISEMTHQQLLAHRKGSVIRINMILSVPSASKLSTYLIGLYPCRCLERRPYATTEGRILVTWDLIRETSSSSGDSWTGAGTRGRSMESAGPSQPAPFKSSSSCPSRPHSAGPSTTLTYETKTRVRTRTAWPSSR